MATKKKKKTNPPAKMGRPTTYTKQIGVKLAERIANGDTVPAACRRLKISFGTVAQWAAENPDFAELYARAREIRTEYQLEELQDIADEGNKKDRFGGNERARLRVDTRKWIIVKMLPKKYGDKIEHDVKGGITVVIDATDAKA